MTVEKKLDLIDDPNVHRLYKYRSFSEGDPAWLEDTILHSRVYFPMAHQLNDPFEANPRIRVLPEDQLRQHMNKICKQNDGVAANLNFLQKKKLKSLSASDLRKRSARALRMVRELARNCPFYSLSEDPFNLQMWGYYGDSHAGLCLEFTYTKAELAEVSNNPSQDPYPVNLNKAFGPAFPVIYQDSLPEFSGYEAVSENQNLNVLLLSKDTGWAHEREQRILLSPEHDQHQAFNPKSLTRIITGCSISEENMIKIQQWSSIRGIPLVKLKRSKIEFELLVDHD